MEGYRFNKKSIYTGLILFVSLIVLYLFVLFLSAIIPAKNIQENIKISTQLIDNQNIYIDPICYYEEESGPTTLDFFSDRIILRNIYNIDPKSPFESVLLNRITDADLLDSSAADAGIDKGFSYSRYWHGYIALWRPLLVFFDYIGLRKLNVFLFNLLVFLVVIFTAKKIGRFAALALSLALIFINWEVIPLVLQYLPVFYIALLASLFILLADINKESTYLKLIFITASLTSFMDLLTSPLATCGMPLLFIVMKQKVFINAQSLKQMACFLFRVGLCWALGFGLTWVIKPILATAFDPNTIPQFVGSFIYRMDGSDSDFFRLRILSVYRTLKMTFIEHHALPTLFLLSILLITGLIYRKKGKFPPVFYAYLLIAIIPCLWCIVVAEHSYSHSWFAYRMHFVTALALLLAFGECVDKAAIKEKMKAMYAKIHLLKNNSFKNI